MLRFESVLIAEILLARLKKFHLTSDDADLLITYGELAKKMQIDINPRNLDYPLGDLSDFCIHECGLPKLSAIVVNRETLLPGDGYFKYFHGNEKPENWICIFLSELELIKKEERWPLLASKLGIE